MLSWEKKYSQNINITGEQFAEWVGLIVPCLYHNGWNDENGKFHIENDVFGHVQAALDYFDVPEFWREPVRIMASGSCYYGADQWYKKWVKDGINTQEGAQ